MGTVLDILNKVKAIDVAAVSVASLNETTETAANLNAVQMFTGIRSTGNQIDANGYAPFTIAEKKRKGQVTDRVTLKDMGAFYKGLVLQATKDTVSFFSTDEKSDMLERRYGKTIFGLTKDSQETYVKEVLLQVAVDKVKKLIGL